MRQRILLIEDDAELGGKVVERLRREGYDVDWWTRGRAVVPEELGDVALVILDIMLPGTYGLDILRDVRPHTDTPFLILSARNDPRERVRALQLGADDYLTKPFWPDELVERVRARLRRPALARIDGAIEVGALLLDLAGRAARVGGVLVELTRAEFDLLVALAQRPGTVRTRTMLAERVLDAEGGADARGLDAHVSRLRKKLGPLVPIETVWGIGYRLAHDGER